MNRKKILLKAMWFFEFWFQVISHYPVKFDVHRTCEIGDIAFFICQESIYHHVPKESCNFVHGGSIPWAIILSILVVISHVKTEKTFFTCHAIIVSCDHCVWWLLLLNYIYFKFSRHGLAEVEIWRFVFFTWPNVTTWTKKLVTLKFGFLS